MNAHVIYSIQFIYGLVENPFVFRKAMSVLQAGMKSEIHSVSIHLLNAVRKSVCCHLHQRFVQITGLVVLELIS